MFRRFLASLLLFFLFYSNILAFSGELNTQTQPNLLQEEETNTGALEDGTGEELNPETSSGGQNVGSGTIEMGTGGTQQEEDYSSRFKLIFQNPSYILDKDIEASSYTCDDSKSECKINFNIEDQELSGFSTKFYCKNDFGFISGEEEKCNPKTIIFGTGSFSIGFKIFKKSDDSLIWEKNLEIINEVEELEEDTGTGIVDTNSGSTETGSGEMNSGTGELDSGSGTIDSGSGDIDNGSGSTYAGSGELTGSGLESVDSGTLEIPFPIIEVQSGLDFLTGSSWRCKKEECKINLTGVSSFTGGFMESDYSCLWSFSGGSFSTEGTENKCNPGYVNYGSGVFDISLKIYEKNNVDNFREETIVIENFPLSNPPTDEDGIEENVVNGGGGGGGGYTPPPVVEKKIIVQSGLDYRSGKYICDDEICKVNLEYPKSYKDTCEWDFGDGDFKEKYLSTCNPGFIHFGVGSHSISVKVFKDGDLINSQSIAFENNYLSDRKNSNTAPVAKITLQGKLAKYKELLSENKIICKGVEDCPINLTGEDSFDYNGDKLSYFWDFGNGETYDGKNPKSIRFGSGDYKIKLIVTDIFGKAGVDEFLVEVLGDKPINFIIDENLSSSLKINGVLPNNSGIDNYEWLELVNTGNKIINLKGLIIDDIIGKGSKAYTIDYDLYLSPFSKKRFYKSETKLSLGNTKDELNIVYNSKVLDNLTWHFKIADDFVLNHKNIDRPLEKVFVIKVVDGDTIDIQFKNGLIERVRLLGVDTPETKHPRKPVEEFGIEASNFTKKSLLNKYIYLERGNQDRGKYGRLLAYIHLESSKGDGDIKLISFNEMLIEKGYARAYLKYPFKYSKRYAELQKIAKKNKVGLWANKEIVDQIKILEQEEKLYLEDIKKQELNDFSEVFENGFNLPVLNQKVVAYKNIASKKISEIKKDIKLKPDFLAAWQRNTPKEEGSLSIVKAMEKQLKKSVSYRVSKQKKGLKITGTSKKYSEIVLVFAGKKINLSIGKDGKFLYYTRDITSGNHKLELFGVDSEVGEIFLKKSRAVELTQAYVSGVLNYKIKYRKKLVKSRSKKSKIKKINIEPEVSEALKPNSGFLQNLLNILLGLITILAIFFLFRRKNILQNI